MLIIYYFLQHLNKAEKWPNHFFLANHSKKGQIATMRERGCFLAGEREIRKCVSEYLRERESGRVGERKRVSYKSVVLNVRNTA